LPNTNDHPLAVDVGYGKVCDLRKPQASGVGGHQDRPVLEVGEGSEEPGQLVQAQHRGKSAWLLDADDLLYDPLLLQREVVSPELVGGIDGSVLIPLVDPDGFTE
jgi:hypothetical protein